MLTENILFLRDRFPHIRNFYMANEDKININHLETMDSKSGQKTIRYKINNEKALMVHSLYDPIREAERVILSHENKIDENTHVFFYGIGLGYHIEVFTKLFPNNSYSLYEPSVDLFYVMANHRPLNKIGTRNIYNLYLDMPTSKLGEYLAEFTNSNKQIHIITLPGYENIFSDKVSQFKKDVKQAILNRRSALHTNKNFQKRWVENSLINFSEVLNTPNIVRDINSTVFKDKPALIVSAGPSLAEDMEFIRYIKENDLAYIFSVGSAINSLISYNILPDAVCTYDPGEINYKVFEKMIDKEVNHVPMVFGTSVGYETLKKYMGPKLHFTTTQDRTSYYFLGEQLDKDKDYIIDSPSIAVMTFQLLNKVGSNPIIFAGQNLGYLYDRIYSEGINYDHVSSVVDSEKLKKSINTKDVYGKEIKTSMSFNNMRESIENVARLYPEKEFINTTKGGAAIEGVAFQPIEDVINRLLTEPTINKPRFWWSAKNTYDKTELSKKYKELERSIEQFKTTISSLENIISSINDYLKIRNKSMVGDLLKQFDLLYNQLNQNVYYRNFLSFYIRVDVQYVANEIKRLNEETDLFNVGIELVRFFPSFISQCKQGNLDLRQVIEESIKRVSNNS
jgi:hypothetical protein